MKKVLIYVDAENIAKDELISFMNSIYSENENGSSQIIGKFYGSKDNIVGLLPICYSLGLDYVETSSLVLSKKNVADMKICVDCIFDALVTYQGLVDTVFILSHDCDFVPLFYKLTGSGIRVEMPLQNVDLENKTTADIENYLHEIGYDPLLADNLFKSQFSAMREILPDNFSDDLLVSFFDKKRKKFLKSVQTDISQNVVDSICQTNVQDFDFKAFRDAIDIDDSDAHILFFADLYTRKLFGVSYPDTVLRLKLQEVLTIDN